MNLLSRRTEYVFTFILALYCFYSLVWSLSTAWGFTTDDAYISFFYARHLAEGKGFIWHQNMPLVEGYSNFLWILIAAALIKLKLPLIISIKIISSCSLFAGLFFLYRLARFFVTPLLAIMPIFVFSHYIGVVWWTVSGLESVFYASLCLLLAWQCLKALGYKPHDESKQETPLVLVNTSAWIMVNLCLLLLSLTRFEGLVWWVPILAYIGCQGYRLGLEQFFAQTRMLYLWFFITVVCFILPYAVYFFWRLYYFGHWIPNSYSCKALASGQFFIVDFDYLQVLLPLIVASLPYLISSRDCRQILLWLPSLLYALMLWKADPVIAHFLRLFLGPFALFTLLPVLGVKQFTEFFKQKKCDPKLITSVVVILITFIFIQGGGSNFLQQSVVHYQERTKSRIAVAELLNQRAAKGASVLLDDCGVIPFNSREDIRFIDAQCLNNLELTQLPYSSDTSLYVEHLYAEVKPDWVISNYYPLESRGDYLNTLLEERGFFDDYQLVTILESGLVKDQKSAKVIDYIYKVYRRKI